MDETPAIGKAFNYSRFAQRAARNDPALADSVRATVFQRPPLAAWRDELKAPSSSTIDATLRRMPHRRLEHARFDVDSQLSHEPGSFPLVVIDPRFAAEADDASPTCPPTAARCR